MPNRWYSFPILVVAVLLLSTGCVPDPVYRLSSTVPDSTADWIQGRKFVTRSSDSLRMTVAYVRTTDQGHKFDVHIENRSDATVMAEPSRIFADVYYMVPSPDTIAPAEDFVMERIWAQDPEQMLLEIDRRTEKVEAEERTSQGLYALGAVTSAAADVADGADTEEEDQTEAIERLERSERRARDRNRNLRRMSTLERRRFRWSETTLRRTTLPPRTGVSGYVYLPVVPNARFLLVHVGPPEERIPFPYRQKRYR